VVFIFQPTHSIGLFLKSGSIFLSSFIFYRF
jgi:hypothetical protein